MKLRFALAGIFAATFPGGLCAQGTGFLPLPPVPHTGQLQNQTDATKFTFVVAGDNRPAKEDLPQPEVLSQIFQDAQTYKPAFFLWCGDIIYGHEDHHKKLEKQYKEFFGIARLAGVPVFNAPGNHEMDTVTKTSDAKIETPDKKLEGYYLEFMKFPKDARPYGAFDYGNSRFIAVDTEEVGASPAPTPTATPDTKLKLDPGYVSPKQIKHLTEDLDANKAKAHIFVFMHHPIMPAKSSSGLDPAIASQLHTLFANYPNVSYVIAAHEHLYFNATGTGLTDPAPSGPSYVISGGAGAPLDKCPDSSAANCVSANHYLVFRVDGDAVTLELHQVPPTLISPSPGKG